MALPTPDTIDWTSLSLWFGGAATVFTSVAIAVWQGVRNARIIAANAPTAPPALHKTDVYTTDSLALERLTNAVTVSNELMQTANDDRRSLRQAVDVNTESTDKSRDGLENLRIEVRDLLRVLERIADRLGR